MPQYSKRISHPLCAPRRERYVRPQNQSQRVRLPHKRASDERPRQPARGNYTVTPSFFGGITFSPASQTVINLTSDQTFNFTLLDLSGNQAANFTGARLTYSITGRVTEGATGVGGVSIALGGGQSGTVLTDAAGNFAFNGLPAGFNYTVTPSRPFFAFSPALRTFPTLSQNQTANFSAVRWAYQASGPVTGACSQAISGVTMTLSHDGINVTAQTNASGFYQLTGAQAGFNYTLTPITFHAESNRFS